MSNTKDLLQLRELYTSGILTEDEYVAARRKLLGYRVVRFGRSTEAPGGNDLPLLFALAALALVATCAAVYFLAFAK